MSLCDLALKCLLCEAHSVRKHMEKRTRGAQHVVYVVWVLSVSPCIYFPRPLPLTLSPSISCIWNPEAQPSTDVIDVCWMKEGGEHLFSPRLECTSDGTLSSVCCAAACHQTEAGTARGHDQHFGPWCIHFCTSTCYVGAGEFAVFSEPIETDLG